MSNVVLRWIWFLLLSVLLCTRSTLVMAMQFGGAYQLTWASSANTLDATEDLAQAATTPYINRATAMTSVTASSPASSTPAASATQKLATGLASMPACHQWQKAVATAATATVNSSHHLTSAADVDASSYVTNDAVISADSAPDHHCCILFGALPSASWPRWSPAVMAAIAQRLPSMDSIHLHALLRPPIVFFSSHA
jgi:hypothetical protein